MKFQLALAALNLLIAFRVFAEATNDLSKAEIQGRQLTRDILEQVPAKNFTNTGTLEIRNADGTCKIPVQLQISIAQTNWSTTYETLSKSNFISLVIIHEAGETNQYKLFNGPPPALARPKFLIGSQTMIPFAGSDFWVADLGLEFLYWPEQKVLPNPTNLKRGRSYTLLESINPNPSTNGYSRVLSYIDKETDGILQAEAYDAHDKLLKEFYPKDFKKVDGQWQVQSMEMDNVQTGSRTRLEFNVKNQ